MCYCVVNGIEKNEFCVEFWTKIKEETEVQEELQQIWKWNEKKRTKPEEKLKISELMKSIKSFG